MENTNRMRIGAWMVVGVTFAWAIAPIITLLAGAHGIYVALYATPVSVLALIFANAYAPQRLAKWIVMATIAGWALTAVLAFCVVQANWSHAYPMGRASEPPFEMRVRSALKGDLPKDASGNFLYPLVMDQAPALAMDQVRYGITRDRTLAVTKWQTDGPRLVKLQHDPTYFLPRGFVQTRNVRFGWLYFLQIGVVSVGANVVATALAKRSPRTRTMLGEAS